MASTGRRVRLLYANTVRPVGHLRRAARRVAGRASRTGSRCVTTSMPTAGSSTRRPSPSSRPTSLDADFYICGPGPFMDLVETTLLELGVDPDRILIERFVTPDQPRPTTAEPTTADVEVPEDGRDHAQGHDHEHRLPARRHRARDRPPGRPATALLVRGGQLRHLHGPAARRPGHDASQQRARRPRRSRKAGSSPARRCPRAPPSRWSTSRSDQPSGRAEPPLRRFAIRVSRRQRLRSAPPRQVLRPPLTPITWPVM